MQNGEFAEFLRGKIASSGITALELAGRTGVPQSTITRFLNGADPRVSTFERICKEFGVTIGDAKKPVRHTQDKR